MQHFYHIIDRDEWEQAKSAGSYSPESVRTEGFIHCSYPSQVLMPANRLFRGKANLVLLEIDPARVTSEIRHDPVEITRHGHPHTEHFPHIYGPLNPDAVVGLVDFPPNPDGSFSLPAALVQSDEG
jgi:uncharacterized protein (DUF952 family)